MKWPSRISLVWLLVCGVLVELALNRIGLQLLPRGGKNAALRDLVDLGGLFSFYFTGVLALFILGWSIIVLIRDKNLFGTASRITLALVAAVFLPLATIGLVLNLHTMERVFRLPPLIAPHLNTTFGLLVLIFVLALVRRPASRRAKLGVLFLVLPLLLHCYWLLTQQVTILAPQGEMADLPGRLLAAGEQLVVVNAFVAFLFFVPFPRWTHLLEPVPLSLALILTGFVGAMAQHDQNLTQQAFYYGLNVRLPAPSHTLQWGLHLLALFFFVLTIGALVLRKGYLRATGSGLLLVALSGFHLQLPQQLLLTLVGLVQIIRGVLAAGRATPLLRENEQTLPIADDQAWKRYLTRLAERCSDTGIAAGIIILHTGEAQIARTRGQRNGLPFTIRIHMRRHVVAQLEIMVAQPPSESPPASLTRVKERRGLRVSSGLGRRVKRFDSRFILRDGTEQVAELLARAAIEADLARWIHGHLACWPAEGIQYWARPDTSGWPLPVSQIAEDAGNAPLEEMEGLIVFLVAVAERVLKLGL